MRALERIGVEIVVMQPMVSALGHWQASLQGFADVDAVWVPCFRQRDLASAVRWAKRRGIPVIFDPLISAFDKQVNERQKFAAQSRRGQRLLRWEQALFAQADALIADTGCHREFFTRTLGCDAKRITVVPVGAEESQFHPDGNVTATDGVHVGANLNSSSNPNSNRTSEVLFFGTFIGLQGAIHIAQAVAHYQGPFCKLTFLGDGPERRRCEQLIAQISNELVSVEFEEWVDYEQLAARIRRADLCLGVFGTGDKTSRLIPNKVYQSLACAVPVLTCSAQAYPSLLQSGSNVATAGITFVPAGDARAIASGIEDFFRGTIQQRQRQAAAAYALYQQNFSNARIEQTLAQLLAQLQPS